MCKRDGMGPHGQGRGHGAGCGNGQGHHGSQGRGRRCCDGHDRVESQGTSEGQKCIERIKVKIQTLQARLAELTS